MSDVHVEFKGKCFLILGFGSIAATFLPMLLRHVAIDLEKIVILSPDDRHKKVRDAYKVRHVTRYLTPDTYQDILADFVSKGDFVLNLTGGVSARDLVKYCLENGIDYLDTSNERWEHGAVFNDAGDYSEQWNLMIAQRDHLPKSATALVSHGANPGIVSHFAKQAIENIAKAEGIWPQGEGAAIDWADLAIKLEVEAFHISERDTQKPDFEAGRNDFFNTWSIEGLVEEGESGPYFAWGTHERLFDRLTTRRDPVCMVATLPQVAKKCFLKSWLPSWGAFQAALIPHEEAFSIAELFSREESQGVPRYQPSVLFAYRPCDQAFEAFHGDYDREEVVPKVLIEEISSGVDELGILVLRKGRKDVYWYGSTLEVNEARALVPFTNATSLQVAAGVLGGLIWVLKNPGKGLNSAEHTDHTLVLEVARPYLGTLEGIEGVWQDAPTTWRMADLMEKEPEVKELAS